MRYVKYFETENQRNNFTLDDTNTPNVSLVEELINTNGGLTYTPFIPRDYSLDYFTFIARQNCTMNFDLLFSGEEDGEPLEVSCGSISYSLDNGKTWSAEYGEIELNLSAGDKVLLKGHMNIYNGEYDQPNDLEGGWIVSTGDFDVEGNIMSLFYGDNFDNKLEVTASTILCNFFKGNTHLINAQNLILPATTLIGNSYSGMFQECTSLITSPKELPAIDLTGAENCYSNMFAGCTSLTTAPELLAHTLTYNCYDHMFGGCTSLITAPELLAISLQDECYNGMFAGCTSLNYIKCLAEHGTDGYNTANWVDGVAATGTFIQDPDAVWNVNSTDGIPSGWTNETEDNPEGSTGGGGESSQSQPDASLE